MLYTPRWPSSAESTGLGYFIIFGAVQRVVEYNPVMFNQYLSYLDNKFINL